MATVDGLTKDRMLAIEAASVVDGDVVGDNLVLTRHDGSTIQAGSVRGPKGDPGTNGVNMTAGARWGNSNAYVVNNTVGYAGRLYTCIQDNVDKCPAFYNNYWTPVTSASPEVWPLIDPLFMAEDLDAYELFWRGGTVSTTLTQTAGEFESGFQAMKIDLGPSSSQRVYERGEVIVRGNEVITVTVRAKLTAPAAAPPTIKVDLLQATKDGSPQPFGSGASGVSGTPASYNLTTSWAFYTFTVQAQLGKPRARMNLIFDQPAGNGSTIVVDRIEVSRVQTKLDLKADQTSLNRVRDTILRQKVMSGGGNRFASVTGISWSQRLILMGAGRISPYAINGYLEISMPADGTVIPRYGLSGGTPGTATVAGGLIPMAAWDALWYELPANGLQTSLPANFRIVNYLSDFPIPDNWVLVCLKNSDAYAAMYKWGDGVEQDVWRNLTAASGWASSPTGTQKTAACLRENNVVRFRGVMTGSLTAATTTQIATVPVECRPIDNPSNFMAVLTTGGFVGWANITDTGLLSIHIKTPFTTGTTTVELSSMSYRIS